MFDVKILDEAIQAHREYWGGHHFNRISDQCIEEAAELIQAISKVRRGQSTSNLVEEICDVLICIEFICRHFGLTKEHLEHIINIKANGLKCNLQLDVNRVNERMYLTTNNKT